MVEKVSTTEDVRIRNLCAYAPLKYNPKRDTRLMKLGLVVFWDNMTGMVCDNPNIPYFDKSGKVLPKWRGVTLREELTSNVFRQVEYDKKQDGAAGQDGKSIRYYHFRIRDEMVMNGVATRKQANRLSLKVTMKEVQARLNKLKHNNRR